MCIIGEIGPACNRFFVDPSQAWDFDDLTNNPIVIGREKVKVELLRRLNKATDTIPQNETFQPDSKTSVAE